MPDERPEPAAPTPRPARGINWRAAAIAAVVTVNLFLGGWFALDRLVLRDLPQVPDKEALWSLGRPPGVTFAGPDAADALAVAICHAHHLQGRTLRIKATA